MNLAFYIALTFIAIIGKLWALAVLRRSWKPSELHALTASFLGTTLLQSTFEIIIYSLDKDSEAGRVALLGYYSCVFMMMSILPFMIAKLVRVNVSKYAYHSIIFLNIIFLYLLFFSSAIIKGVNHNGITLTRVPGDSYWLFQISMLSSIAYCLYILTIGKKSTNGFIKIRANNILLSFSIFAGFGIFIIISMQLSEKFNAAGILPICITLFVMGVIDNICNKDIVDYSYWIPFSKKRREINKLIKPFIEIQSDGLDPELKKEYNKLITQHALKLFDGNQTKAAEWLRVSQSWVSRNNKSLDE